MNNYKKIGVSDKITGVVLVLPALAIFTTIILYPFINSVIMGFTNRSMLSPESKFIGLSNYIKILSDPNFKGIIINTMIFVVFSTILPFILGLIWAVILNVKFRGSELMRGITLVNWIIPGTSIGFLWMWIFHGEYGVLNGILQNLGIISEKINWLGKQETAMIGVIVARTWQMLPWYMAFLLGGLQGISSEQLEAARIDGANNLQAFFKIIIPGMKSIITLVLILGTIGNLQHFDLIWVMTQGGPARATTTLSIEVYRSAFQNWDMGKAAAIGTIWAMILAGFSFIYLRNIKDED